jgi:hypothetical protein
MVPSLKEPTFYLVLAARSARRCAGSAPALINDNVSVENLWSIAGRTLGGAGAGRLIARGGESGGKGRFMLVFGIKGAAGAAGGARGAARRDRFEGGRRARPPF